MTRIIAGIAGGRRLRTPPGSRTRPTTDRVREALFSAVESRLGSLADLAVLDLYAGSGAVGLEARSRGARPVTLVEQDRRTAALIERNARDLGLDEVRVVCASVAAHLAGTARAAEQDLVFLDPPYDLAASRVQADLGLLAAGGWLVAGALVVVERSSRDAGGLWPPGFAPLRSRAYGETSLHLAEWPAPGGAVGDPGGDTAEVTREPTRPDR